MTPLIPALAAVWGPEIGTRRTLRALVERGLVEVRSTTTDCAAILARRTPAVLS